MRYLGGTTGTRDRWDDQATDPIKAIREERIDGGKRTGFRFDAAIFGAELFEAVAMHTLVRSTLTNGSSAVLRAEPANEEEIARLCGLDYVRVASAIYNTSLVMTYVSFGALAWNCYTPIGHPDWTVGPELLRHTLGDCIRPYCLVTCRMSSSYCFDAGPPPLGRFGDGDVRAEPAQHPLAVVARGNGLDHAGDGRGRGQAQGTRFRAAATQARLLHVS